jgi:hypothetical protein
MQVQVSFADNTNMAKDFVTGRLQKSPKTVRNLRFAKRCDQKVA